ncbi:MAG TPA: hypothetical protein DCZ03_04955 [Gammaproteobacteria bacterium]|nr:hypothetical protein [Gammaproteobacteria bacterium]
MNTQVVQFFWDIGSPYSYLATTQIRNIVDKYQADLDLRPFLLGAVFKETGNKPPITLPAKSQYMPQDLNNWCEFYQVPLTFPKDFPINSVMPMRAAVAAHRLGNGETFALSLYHAYWGEGQDVSQPEILQQVANACGLNGNELLELTQDQSIKDELRENVALAVHKGAFGAPTFYLGEKMFWGVDHLPLLEFFLAKQSSST